MRRFCSTSLLLMTLTLMLAGVGVTLLTPTVRVGGQETASVALDRKVAVYVPGTVNVSRLSPELAERMTHKSLERFSELFGGATMVSATGAWMSKEGLVKEPVQIVYSFTRQPVLQEKMGDVLALARELCEKMGQESICLEVDGRLYFVDRTTRNLR